MEIGEPTYVGQRIGGVHGEVFISRILKLSINDYFLNIHTSRKQKQQGTVSNMFQRLAIYTSYLFVGHFHQLIDA